MFEKRLTRFELTKIVAARYMMLLRGAPPLVKVEGDDLMEAAKREILERKLPLTIIRIVSVGSKFETKRISLEDIEEISQEGELRCLRVSRKPSHHSLNP